MVILRIALDQGVNEALDLLQHLLDRHMPHLPTTHPMAALQHDLTKPYQQQSQSSHDPRTAADRHRGPARLAVALRYTDRCRSS